MTENKEVQTSSEIDSESMANPSPPLQTPAEPQAEITEPQREGKSKLGEAVADFLGDKKDDGAEEEYNLEFPDYAPEDQAKAITEMFAKPSGEGAGIDEFRVRVVAKGSGTRNLSKVYTPIPRELRRSWGLRIRKPKQPSRGFSKNPACRKRSWKALLRLSGCIGPGSFLSLLQNNVWILIPFQQWVEVFQMISPTFKRVKRNSCQTRNSTKS